MGKTLSRTAAFVALWRELRRAHREGPSLGVRLAALPRLVVATLRRRRRYDGGWRLILMVVALLYVLTPVDLIPELFLGPIGLIDDLVVVSWLAGAVLAETGRFLRWETLQRAAALAKAQPGAEQPGAEPPGAEQPGAEQPAAP